MHRSGEKKIRRERGAYRGGLSSGLEFALPQRTAAAISTRTGATILYTLPLLLLLRTTTATTVAVRVY